MSKVNDPSEKEMLRLFGCMEGVLRTVCLHKGSPMKGVWEKPCPFTLECSDVVSAIRRLIVEHGRLKKAVGEWQRLEEIIGREYHIAELPDRVNELFKSVRDFKLGGDKFN
jgi:hypothetical protein